MKRLIVLTCVFAAVIASCKNEEKRATRDDIKNAAQDTSKYTSIEWLDSLTKNIGTIKFGDKAKITYRFKNTGSYPLLIEEVKASCGCTVTEYTKAPIPPGETGEVTGAFDSNKSSPGQIHKTLTVRTANTKIKKEFWLVFTGIVDDNK